GPGHPAGRGNGPVPDGGARHAAEIDRFGQPAVAGGRGVVQQSESEDEPGGPKREQAQEGERAENAEYRLPAVPGREKVGGRGPGPPRDPVVIAGEPEPAGGPPRGGGGPRSPPPEGPAPNNAPAGGSARQGAPPPWTSRPRQA